MFSIFWKERRLKQKKNAFWNRADLDPKLTTEPDADLDLDYK